jgi:hypothetical protein
VRGEKVHALTERQRYWRSATIVALTSKAKVSCGLSITLVLITLLHRRGRIELRVHSIAHRVVAGLLYTIAFSSRSQLKLLLSEENIMATFISLINFTDQGMRNIKDSPEHYEAFQDMAENLGLKV